MYQIPQKYTSKKKEKLYLSGLQLQRINLCCPIVRKIKFTHFAIIQISKPGRGFAPKLCQFTDSCCLLGLGTTAPGEIRWALLHFLETPHFGKALELWEMCSETWTERERSPETGQLPWSWEPGRQVVQQTAPLVGLGPPTRCWTSREAQRTPPSSLLL